MSRAVITLSELYEYKLIISMKSLIWYRQPVTHLSFARLSLFGSQVNLCFGNQTSRGTRQVEFQIEDSLQLAGFYQQPLIIDIVNLGKKNQDNSVAYVQLDPRVITEKPIIAPILSRYDSKMKLGDIEIKFTLNKSAISIEQLREINQTLDYMIEKKPEEFQSLCSKLRREGLTNFSQS